MVVLQSSQLSTTLAQRLKRALETTSGKRRLMVVMWSLFHFVVNVILNLSISSLVQNIFSVIQSSVSGRAIFYETKFWRRY